MNNQIINSVTGPLTSDQLGRTLMHEHFLFGYCGFQGDATLGGFQEEAYLSDCLQAIEDAKSYGIQTIVDATTNECGRNVKFLKKLSEMTGMQIICSTGYYFEAESSFAYWQFRSGFADIEQEIYEMMKAEVTCGIEGTDIKAGVIKLASSKDQITPMEEHFFKAAARVQKETGVVIITHTQQGTMGAAQARLLIDNGGDPSKIAIGHMCGSLDPAYHEEVLSYGVYINLDRFGLQGDLFHTPTDEQRMNLIQTLVEKGYGNKILLGHDSVNVNLGRPIVMTDFMKEALKDANIRTIGCKVLPGLKQRGLSDCQIEALLTDNPKEIFSDNLKAGR